MPDREERHLLSEDLGSGEPVSRASAQKNKKRKLNKLLINEAEDAIEAEFEKSKVLFGQD